MTVNNQGHIFQSCDQTTTCIFTALLDLDVLRVRAEPLFKMQITEYYIDCLLCLSQFDPAILDLARLRHNPSKSAHPSLRNHSVPPKPYFVKSVHFKAFYLS